jgi:fatty aldehyde decarbonylase
VSVASRQRVRPEEYRAVFADILSQAVTGELIGMANYAAMAQLYDDGPGQIDAVEHAFNERGHARSFERAARDLGVSVISDVSAPYWRRIREAFLRHVQQRDLEACLIIQEVMLEAFAVSMYHAVGDVADGKLGEVFHAIGAEEEGHLEHSIEELRESLEKDRAAFEGKVERLHNEVMTVLAEMVGKDDAKGHCGLCHGSCVKDSLHCVGLSTAELRGRALEFYLRTLDRIGVTGERSLRWVANLPV